MKNVKSPTGCVHRIEAGSEREGYMTLCLHTDYNKSYGDGYFHHWYTTSKPVTCKRCLAAMIRKAGPTYTEEVMYQWPASQICEGCGYAYKVLNYKTNEDFVLCNKKCKLNDGHTCPEFKEVGEDEG